MAIMQLFFSPKFAISRLFFVSASIDQLISVFFSFQQWTHPKAMTTTTNYIMTATNVDALIGPRAFYESRGGTSK